MNILTFDIEDWYCHDVESGNKDWEKLEVRIYEGVDRILDSLSNRNQKATFFVLGWLAEHHPAVIKKIAQAGHEIGSHTYQHDLLTCFNRQDFFEDTYRTKSIIEDVIGKPIRAFRAPAFSITEKNLFAFDVLGDLGFTIDCSIFPAQRDYGGLPMFQESKPCIIEHNGYRFKEFPISPVLIAGRNVVFSGGGYFRLFPYPIIRSLTEGNEYNMTYFHPSDFDPDQPDMPHLSIRQRIKNRIGLNAAYSKYLRYISEFKFVDVDTAVSQIDWEEVPVVNL